MPVQQNLVILTGLAGAGRSTAAHAFEDLGYMVIDNLPPKLLSAALELLSSRPEARQLAVVVDARGGSLFADLADAINAVEAAGVAVKIVFLEATDNALVRRFESSRRPHPLKGDFGVLPAIHAERQLLSEIRDRADLIIDTSDRNVHDLRRLIEANFDSTEAKLQVIITSFGFKYGIPLDADLVADMRFLPNPYWEPDLRTQTGIDAPVNDYVVAQPAAKLWLDKYTELLQIALPGYLQEGKRFVTIGIGCTGGQHRSVAMAENLSARLVIAGIEVEVIHRDRGRE